MIKMENDCVNKLCKYTQFVVCNKSLELFELYLQVTNLIFITVRYIIKVTL